jgi:hypothetical protein
MLKHLVIYEKAVCHIWLFTRSLLNLPIYEKNFFNSVIDQPRQVVCSCEAGGMDRQSRTKSHPAGSLYSSQPGGPPCWTSPLAFGIGFYTVAFVWKSLYMCNAQYMYIRYCHRCKNGGNCLTNPSNLTELKVLDRKDTLWPQSLLNIKFLHKEMERICQESFFRCKGGKLLMLILLSADKKIWGKVEHNRG